MFKSFLKIALRNIIKNFGYSMINVLGLALGLAVSMLITSYVIDELSYDKYNANANRIYRVNADFYVRGSQFNDRDSPAPMAGVLTRDYPQIENAVRIKDIGKTSVSNENQTIIEDHSYYADSTLFAVFTLPTIAGDPKTALNQPHSLVVSESIAKKYFNNTDVIGKILRLNNANEYKITAVIKDMPPEAHLHLNLIRSMSGLESSKNTEWLNVGYMTYLLVKPGVTQRDLDFFLKQATKKYAEPGLQYAFHSSISELEQNGEHFKFVTIPLTKIHLFSTLTTEIEPSGNIQYVYDFILITLFILLIACVNFVNLSTARSSSRAKEVGVRKVMGSNRAALIWQFLTESVTISFISLMVAVIIALILRPYFNQLCGKDVPLTFLSLTWILPSLLLASLLIGVLAGAYPAFFMSSFQPIQVLKGRLASGFKGSWLRNALIIFQFTTVIILIIGTMVIYRQLNFIRDKKLGYNREQVLILQNTGTLGLSAKSFEQDVLKLSGVKSGTITPFLPILTSNAGKSLYTKNASGAGQMVTVSEWSIDEGYIPTLEMQMVSGRNFSTRMLTDSNAVILNETAARMLGYANPIDKTVYAFGGDNTKPFNIIGVVKDFNFGSLRNTIAPLVLRLRYNNNGMAFRIQSQNIPTIIGLVERLYHAANANMKGQPLDYSFMDDAFDHLYKSEKNTGKIFFLFAFFAILIAFFGLFGLVTYAAEQRTKEIGIRKVLGASLVSILRMLSADFLKLIAVALVVAFPIAWWAMNNWLQGFAYRTNISFWIFVIAAVVSFTITIITISFRTIKAALASPTKSLRAE